MLLKLASANCTVREWSTVSDAVQALESLMDATDAAAWPPWLLPRLCAAVARGLQRSLLGMSGQKPKSALLYAPRTSSNSGAVATVLHTLCAIGELMCRVTEVLLAMRDGQAPQLMMPEAECVKMFTTKTGRSVGLMAVPPARRPQQYFETGIVVAVMHMCFLRPGSHAYHAQAMSQWETCAGLD